MKYNFLVCGLTGWCMEVFWTGLHSLQQGHWTLTGSSSLWMFPIYGCAAIISPISKKLARVPWVLRGSIYTAGIFATEYATGSILKRFQACPWDYSGTPFQYQGLIRFDYAPVWFITGLLFEKILRDNG
ncbi:MAG: putative ABC transporter permease [Lachnospiraceae bacterium]|jgi:uncharacterized membrane protein